MCGPRPGIPLLYENISNNTVYVDFPFTTYISCPDIKVRYPTATCKTTVPYDKHQTYYSINPDADATMTNYFIFPDFDNDDPLCAIFVRWSVTSTPGTT